MTNQEDGNDRTETAAFPPTKTQEHTPLPDGAGIPERIGQYRIKRAIASGGMGTVYEAGTHGDGKVTVPYFAMAYIVGTKPVTDYAKDKKLGTRERMKLFANVCEAVIVLRDGFRRLAPNRPCRT